MIKLMRHPKGPSIEGKKLRFRSYVDLADYADEHLEEGLYFVRNHNAVNLIAIREIHHHVDPWSSSFHVEGRGNV